MVLWLVFNSILLGFGLAMDAFSVSLANGFSEPRMNRKRMLFISGIYAFFQFIMPVIGYFLVRFAVSFFEGISKFIPFISLILLGFIGGNMLKEGIAARKCTGGGECDKCQVHECDVREVVEKGDISFKLLILQGIATSIDALSVGLTIEGYSIPMMFVAAIIIGVITHAACFVGLFIGKKFGTRFAGSAKIIGGVLLIAIGIEIFIKGIL
jgi:putative Mn2+ efflux pump MntP